MKLELIGKCESLEESLPVRGAWIEIIVITSKIEHESSLPVRGAWIEIFDQIDNGISVMVAPRKGSVD